MGFFGKRKLLGLDIGNSLIKAVQLKRRGDNLQLASLATIEIPPEIQDEVDASLKSELLAETIKRLIKENNIDIKDVVTSISGDMVIVRYVKLPYMNQEELKNVITYEAEQYIPLAIDQVVLDFEILGELEEEGQKKIEVLLVAAKEEIVDQHMQILKLAGLNPVLIDVDTFALENAYEHNYGKQLGETVGLIHIGAKLTTINILEDGTTHLTRDVAVAGNNFTREIQREFDVPWNEAERLKCQEGQVLTESEDILQMEIPKKEDKATRIGETVVPVINKLIAEIRRSFDYYESSIRKKSISRIVLSGGASRLKNLDKFFAEKLDVQVEFNDPFKNILVTEKDFDLEYITAHAQLFNVGVGLALRQVD